MKLYHSSTVVIEKPDVLHSNTVDLYFAGVISKEEALGRLRFEKPNHQICILNGEMLDKHLHFVKAERIENGSK